MQYALVTGACGGIGSVFVKKLFAKITPHKLAIVAEKINVKGKIKYVIKNLYTTLY